MEVVDLDRDGDRPVYLLIADWVTTRIEDGTYPPRRVIPSEIQLVQIFGVARETARHAVAELRARGLVYTVPQRGTYVTPPEDRPTS